MVRKAAAVVIDPMTEVVPPKAKTKQVAVISDPKVGGRNVVASTAGKNKLDIDVQFADSAIRHLALRFNLDFDLPRDVRMDRAVQHMNQSAQYMLAAGLDLLALREECQHGEFMDLLEARSLEQRAANRAMQYTQFLLSRSDDERNKLLDLKPTNVLAIASADPEVIEDLLKDDERDLKGLSVNALRNTIKDLAARKTDVTVQLEKAELEVERLRGIVDNLREARVKTGGDVPVPVQDLRLECAALYMKAELSLEDMDSLMRRFVNEQIELADWFVPVARHIAAALTAMHTHTGGLLQQLHSSFGEEVIGDRSLAALDAFSAEETLRCAQEYKSLIAEHDHEKQLREWERESAKPRGKGRPTKRPEAK